MQREIEMKKTKPVAQIEGTHGPHQTPNPTPQPHGAASAASRKTESPAKLKPLPLDDPSLQAVMETCNAETRGAIESVFRRDSTSARSRSWLQTHCKRRQIITIMNAFNQAQRQEAKAAADEAARAAIDQRHEDEATYVPGITGVAYVKPARSSNSSSSSSAPPVAAQSPVKITSWAAALDREEELGRKLTDREMATNPGKFRPPCGPERDAIIARKQAYRAAVRAERFAAAEAKRAALQQAYASGARVLVQIRAAERVAETWSERMLILGACDSDEEDACGVDDDGNFIELPPRPTRDRVSSDLPKLAPHPELQYALNQLVPLFVAGGFAHRQFSVAMEMPFSVKKLARVSAARFARLARWLAHVGGDPLCFAWARAVDSGYTPVTRVLAAAAKIILTTYRQRSPQYARAIRKICKELACKHAAHGLAIWSCVTDRTKAIDVWTVQCDNVLYPEHREQRTNAGHIFSKYAVGVCLQYNDQIHDTNDKLPPYATRTVTTRARQAEEAIDAHTTTLKLALTQLGDPSVFPPSQTRSTDVEDTKAARKRWLAELSPSAPLSPYDEGVRLLYARPLPEASEAQPTEVPPDPPLVGIETNPGPASTSSFANVTVDGLTTVGTYPSADAYSQIEISMINEGRNPLILYFRPLNTSGSPISDPDTEKFTIRSGCSLSITRCTPEDDFTLVVDDFAGEIALNNPTGTAIFLVNIYTPACDPIIKRTERTLISREHHRGGPSAGDEGVQETTVTAALPLEEQKRLEQQLEKERRLFETNRAAAAARDQAMLDRFGDLSHLADQAFPPVEPKRVYRTSASSCEGAVELDPLHSPATGEATAETSVPTAWRAAEPADARKAATRDGFKQLLADDPQRCLEAVMRCSFDKLGGKGYRAHYEGRFIALVPLLALDAATVSEAAEQAVRIKDALEKARLSNLAALQKKAKKKAKRAAAPGEAEDAMPMLPNRAQTKSRADHLASCKEDIAAMDFNDLLEHLGTLEDAALRNFALRRIRTIVKERGRCVKAVRTGWYAEEGGQNPHIFEPDQISQFEVANKLRALLETVRSTDLTTVEDGWAAAQAEAINELMHMLNGNIDSRRIPCTTGNSACAQAFTRASKAHGAAPRSSDGPARNRNKHAENGNAFRVSNKQNVGRQIMADLLAPPKEDVEGIVTRVYDAVAPSVVPSAADQVLRPTAKLADGFINDLPFAGAVSSLLGRLEVPEMLRDFLVSRQDADLAQIYNLQMFPTGPFQAEIAAFNENPTLETAYNAAASAHGRALGDPTLGVHVRPLANAADFFSDLRNAEMGGQRTSERHRVTLPTRPEQPRQEIFDYDFTEDDIKAIIAAMRNRRQHALNGNIISELDGIEKIEKSTPNPINVGMRHAFLSIPDDLAETYARRDPAAGATSMALAHMRRYGYTTKTTAGAVNTTYCAEEAFAHLGFLNRFVYTDATPAARELHLIIPETPSYVSLNSRGRLPMSYTATPPVLSIVAEVAASANSYGAPFTARAALNRMTDLVLSRYISGIIFDVPNMRVDAGAMFHKMWEMLAISATLGPNGIRGNLRAWSGVAVTAGQSLPDLDAAAGNAGCFIAADHWPASFVGGDAYATDDSGFVASARLTQLADFTAVAFPAVAAGGGLRRQDEYSLGLALRTPDIAKVFIGIDDDAVMTWFKITVAMSSYLQMRAFNGLTYTAACDAVGGGATTNNTHSAYACTAAQINDDGPVRIVLLAEGGVSAINFAGAIVRLGDNFNAYNVIAAGYRHYSYEVVAETVAKFLARANIDPVIFDSYCSAAWTHVQFQAMPRHDSVPFDANGQHPNSTDCVPFAAAARGNHAHATENNGNNNRGPYPTNCLGLHLPGAGDAPANREGMGTGQTPFIIRPTMISDAMTLFACPHFLASANPPPGGRWSPPRKYDFIRRCVLSATIARLEVTKVRAAFNVYEAQLAGAVRSGSLLAKVLHQYPKGSLAAEALYYLGEANLPLQGLVNEDQRVVLTPPIPQSYASSIGMADIGLNGYYRTVNKLLSVRPQPAATCTIIPAAAPLTYYPIPADHLDKNLRPGHDASYYATAYAALRHIVPPDAPANIWCSGQARGAAAINQKVWNYHVLNSDALPAGALPAGTVRHHQELCNYAFSADRLFGPLSALATQFPATAAFPAAATLAVLEGSTPINWGGTLQFLTEGNSVESSYAENAGTLAQAQQDVDQEYVARGAQALARGRASYLEPYGAAQSTGSSSSSDNTESMVVLTPEETKVAVAHQIEAEARLLNTDDATALRAMFGSRWPERYAMAVHSGRYYTSKQSRAYCENLNGNFVSPGYSTQRQLRSFAEATLDAAAAELTKPTRFAEGIADLPAYANLSRMSLESAAKLSRKSGMPRAIAEWLSTVHVPFQKGLHIAYAQGPGARFAIELAFARGSTVKPTTEGLVAFFKAVDVIALKCGAVIMGYPGPDPDVQNLSTLVGYAPRPDEYIDDIAQTANDYFSIKPRPDYFMRAFARATRAITPRVARQTRIRREITTEYLVDDPLEALTPGSTAELAGPNGERVKKNAAPKVADREYVRELFEASVLVATIVAKINEKGKYRRIMPTSFASHMVFMRFILRTGFMKKFQRAGTAGTSDDQLLEAFKRMDKLAQGWYGFPIDYPRYDEQQNHEFAKILWEAIADAYRAIDTTAAEYAEAAGKVFTTKYVRFPNLDPEVKGRIQLDWLSEEQKRKLAYDSRSKVGKVDVAQVHNGMLSGQSSTTMENTMLGIGYWNAITDMAKMAGGRAITLGVTVNCQAGDDTDIYVRDPAMAHSLYNHLSTVFKMRDSDYSCRPDHTVFLKRVYSGTGFRGYLNRALVPWYQRDPLSPLSSDPRSDVNEVTELAERCMRRGGSPAVNAALARQKYRSIARSYGVDPKLDALHAPIEAGGWGVPPLLPIAVPKAQRVRNRAAPRREPTEYEASIAASWREHTEPDLPISAYEALVMKRSDSAVDSDENRHARTEARAAWDGWNPTTIPIRTKTFDIAQHMEYALGQLRARDPGKPLQRPKMPYVDVETLRIATEAYGQRGAFDWMHERGMLPARAKNFPHYSLALALLTQSISLGPGTSTNALISDFLGAWFAHAFWTHAAWFKRLAYEAAVYSINASVAAYLRRQDVRMVLSAYAE